MLKILLCRRIAREPYKLSVSLYADAHAGPCLCCSHMPTIKQIFSGRDTNV